MSEDTTLPRPGLRLDPMTIVETALVIADRGGLARVSMRTVAKAVGVAPMSLYRHVRSKEELLERMFERVIETIMAALPPGWTAEPDIAVAARRVRETLRLHPNWIPLVTELLDRPAARTSYERLASRLDPFGRTEPGTLPAVALFTLGAVLVERALARATGDTERMDEVFETGLVALLTGAASR